jgi:hypothetical protein
MVQRERADAVRVLRETNHSDQIIRPPRKSVAIAQHEPPEHVLDHVQPRHGLAARRQVRVPHAARSIDDHLNRDPFGKDLIGLVRPLRPRHRDDQAGQSRDSQCRQDAPQTCGPARSRGAQRRQVGEPQRRPPARLLPQPPQQR